MKIFDTHAHYDDDAFDEDRDQLLEYMENPSREGFSGDEEENEKIIVDNYKIEKVVNVGASMASSQRTIDLTEKYNFIYGAIGVHPEETNALTEKDMEWLKKESQREKIIAIGEIGLDYYWESVPRELQKKWFDRQLELAKEVVLPVIIHSRDAAKDTIDMLQSANESKDMRGIIHCYSYSKEAARDYLNMGFYFGIGGVVTFKNAKKVKETVEYVPLEQIVLETDCPYLAPTPHRGDRNSSLNLPYVIEEIAAIKGISVEKVAQTTYENACKIYGI